MIDNTINTAVESGDLTPVTPPNVANPPIPPLVPLGAWTWNTPVIPTFYWNVYSAEQRIRQICLELGRIAAWCDYATATANTTHMELSKRIDELAAKLTEEVTRLDQRIDEETKAREVADALLQEGLDKETARAKAVEQVLQSNIDTETANRESADETLDEKIADETKRASEEEHAIRAELAAETTRAESVENALQSSIDTETADREAADSTLDARIEVENGRAVSAEEVLRKSVDTEAASRESADNELASSIRANKTSADEADKRIQDSLDTEIANRKNGDIALGERIDTEATARSQSDTNLETLIANEASNRTTADTLLTQQVNRRVKATNVTADPASHITVVSTVSDTDPDATTVVIGDTYTAEFDMLEESIANEVTRATGAESELYGKIVHETTDRESADEQLNKAVAERLKATGVIAGDNITVQVDPDATTVTISATGGGFDGVVTDTTLTGVGTKDEPLVVNTDNIASMQSLNAEASVRETADTTLQTKLESVEKTADSALQPNDLKAGDNITITSSGSELTISSSAGVFDGVVVDTSELTGDGTKLNPLGVNMDNIAGVAALNDETEARTSADAALSDRIDTKLDVANVSGVNGITVTKTANSVTIDGDALMQPSDVKAGSNVSVEYGDGTVTISASGGGGGLSEVAVTDFLYGKGTSSSPIGIMEDAFDTYVSDTATVTRLDDADAALEERMATVETSLEAKLDTVSHEGALDGSGTADDPLDLSDATKASLTKADTALQRVYVNTTYFSGTGVSTSTINFNSTYQNLMSRLNADNSFVWARYVNFPANTTTGASQLNFHPLAPSFTTRNIVTEISNTTSQEGMHLGIYDIQTTDGNALTPTDYKTFQVRFIEPTAVSGSWPAKVVLEFTPVYGTSTTMYRIVGNTPSYTAGTYTFSYTIASSGTSTSIPANLYSLIAYTIS